MRHCRTRVRVREEVVSIPGYSNAVVHLDFSELSDNPDEKIWVAVRNFKLMPPGDLAPREITLDADGKPVDAAEAQEAMYEVFAKAIIGWRVPDPATLAVDPDTGEVLPMKLMEHPPNLERVKRLPLEIIGRLAEELAKAVNPPSDPASPITKTLS